MRKRDSIVLVLCLLLTFPALAIDYRSDVPPPGCEWVQPPPVKDDGMSEQPDPVGEEIVDDSDPVGDKVLVCNEVYPTGVVEYRHDVIGDEWWVFLLEDDVWVPLKPLDRSEATTVRTQADLEVEIIVGAMRDPDQPDICYCEDGDDCEAECKKMLDRKCPEGLQVYDTRHTRLQHRDRNGNQWESAVCSGPCEDDDSDRVQMVLDGKVCTIWGPGYGPGE